MNNLLPSAPFASVYALAPPVVLIVTILAVGAIAPLAVTAVVAEAVGVRSLIDCAVNSP